MAVATTTFSGRAFSVREVTLIREIVRDCAGLSRMELARTVCELLRWRRPNGRLKARECREFLERLDAGGALVLPDKRPGPCDRVGHPRAPDGGGRAGAPVVELLKVTFSAPSSTMLTADRRWRMPVCGADVCGRAAAG